MRAILTLAFLISNIESAVSTAITRYPHPDLTKSYTWTISTLTATYHRYPHIPDLPNNLTISLSEHPITPSPSPLHDAQSPLSISTHSQHQTADVTGILTWSRGASALGLEKTFGDGDWRVRIEDCDSGWSFLRLRVGRRRVVLRDDGGDTVQEWAARFRLDEGGEACVQGTCVLALEGEAVVVPELVGEVWGGGGT